MPEFWTDHSGIMRKVPTGKKLKFSSIPLHALLRAFVYVRDNFTCQWCKAKAVDIPAEYDGKTTLRVNRINKNGWRCVLNVDHVISRRNSGSNHPSNLQTLCDSCNSSKSGLIDAKGANYGAH